MFEAITLCLNFFRQLQTLKSSFFYSLDGMSNHPGSLEFSNFFWFSRHNSIRFLIKSVLSPMQSQRN